MPRLLSWNILQGGGRRAGDIVNVIAGHKPDIVTLQEFRLGSGADEILSGLKKLGLTFIYHGETTGPAENTILIASRFWFRCGTISART